MSDALDQFAQDLAGEVEDAVAGPDSFTAFSSEMFTRTVLERLEDSEQLDGAVDMFQEGWSGRAGYRIDGYSIDEERGTLELFTTIHTGELPPRKLAMPEVRAAYVTDRSAGSSPRKHRI